MKKIILTITFLFIALFTVACNEAHKIKFTQSQISVTVNVEINLPINTTITNLDEIKYSFSKEDSVEVDGDTFTFLIPGEITIKAYWEKDETVFDTISVIVEDVQRKIEFEESQLSIYKDEEKSLSFSISNLEPTDLAYKLSNQSTVEITDNWMVKAKQAGVVTLTIFYIEDDTVSADLTINVEVKKTIIFSSNEIRLDVNSENHLPVILTGIQIEEVEFVLNVQDIISLEGSKIIPLKPGTVKVSAVYKADVSVFATIDVIVPYIEPEYTVSDYQYWIKNLDPKYNPHETILSQSEIDTYNNTILSNYNATKVLDIFTQPKTISKAGLESLINNYSNMSRYTVYNDQTKAVASTAQKEAILANRNLSSISATTNLKYGIVTDFAALRSYPTNFYSSTYSLDRFQETGLNVGEGAIVYHTSTDGNWYFIQAQNYNGWIEAKNIAICTFEQMQSFLMSNDFIIVTADMLLINDVYVRMGQRIPFTNETLTDYTISFPTRDSLGNLVLQEINISKDLDVSNGYLNYTLENIYMQAFKMLGIPYSWGDKEVEGRDCSSTLNAIYATFGFKMPRNTSNQNKIPNYSVSKSFTLSEITSNYHPGSLIFSSGHVLMYIGEDIDGNVYVFHNTNGGIPGCKVQTLSSYGINSIIASLKLYNE